VADDKQVLSTNHHSKYFVSLRSKGYLAYAILLVFISSLLSFAFYQKNILLQQLDALQAASESEMMLHDMDLKILNIIDTQVLNIKSIDLLAGSHHIEDHLAQFQRVYDTHIMGYIQDFKSATNIQATLPDMVPLGIALDESRKKTNRQTLNTLTDELQRVKILLEQQMGASDLNRKTEIEKFRARSDSVAWILLLFGLGGLVVVGAIIGVFFTRLVRDLIILKQKSLEIVGGIRHGLIPIKRNDEVGELASAVQYMELEIDEHEESREIERHKYFHREKMASMGRLTAGIAHEVGNPIAALTALVKEIIDHTIKGKCPYMDEKDLCKLNTVLEHANRLGKITREISGLVQPQSEIFQLFDLNELIRSTCNIMRYDNRWKNLELDLHLDKNLPAINGISDQITQVLMNCLVNSADALENIKNRNPRINIMTYVDDDYACCRIKDNGEGMNQETLKNAKLDFYTTKSKGRGTGLGLSLCNSIINSHNGKLEINASPDKGTTIYISLPCPNAENKETGIVS